MTGVVVVYNTKDLIEKSFYSIRKIHPQLPIIIIDNSDRTDPCYCYVDSLKSEITKVVHTCENIGHGPGMDKGIRLAQTDLVLIFDSDIVMLKSPLSGMLSMMEHDTYGVGWINEVGEDGFDFGTPYRKHEKRVPYLHPYFQIIRVEQYLKFAPYCHHGAPCYKSMIDIYDKGLSSKILKHYPGLTGHTSGRGANWIGRPSEYIQHDFGGTRMANVKAGKKEIPGIWER